MLRTRLALLAFLGLAVAARAQALFSDDFSATLIDMTHWTTSTPFSDSRTAIFNREGVG